MKTDQKKCVLWGVLAAAILLILNGCGTTIETESLAPDRQIAIDGNDKDWHNWFYQNEKTGTNAAICNDADYVYICFTTQDQKILRQMVRQGFVVWFNSKGNKSKELGINFPFVNREEAGGPGGAPSQGGGAPPGGSGAANSISVAEMKILTSAKDEGTVLSMDKAEAAGITAKIYPDQSGKLIYELKMPLKKGDNRPYVVQASAENIIGVGLMTVKQKSSRVSGISGFGGSMSDMSGGGMGGGGGGGGMGGGGGGGGGGFDSSAAGGFNSGDISSMSKIYDFFGTDEDLSTMTKEDVSAINAQGAPPGGGGGMGGGMGGGDMGGSSMGSSSMGSYESSFEIWAAVTLRGM